MKHSLLLLLAATLSLNACQRAQDFYAKGIAKKEYGDYKGAKSDFTKAIELDYEFLANNLMRILRFCNAIST